MVYPNMDFILSLTPTDETASSHMLSSGDPACSDATSNSTYCTVNVSRDVYIISVNLTNDLGSTINSSTFDSELCRNMEKSINQCIVSTAQAVIVEEEMLEDGQPLSVKVTVNSRCPMKCLVTVAFGTNFGTNPLDADGCDIQTNVTKGPLYPGETALFSIEAGSITRKSDDIYCYLVSLCGNLGKYA